MKDSSHRFQRYTRSYAERNTGKRQAIKAEHLLRLKRGKDDWNAWSEAFGKWIEEHDIKDAVIDLSEIAIDHSDFNGYVFRAYTNFSQAWFICDGDFRDAVHTNYETFIEAQLDGQVELWGATCGMPPVPQE